MEIFEEGKNIGRAKTFKNLFNKVTNKNPLAPRESIYIKYNNNYKDAINNVNSNNNNNNSNPGYESITDKEIDNFYSKIKSSIEINNNNIDNNIINNNKKTIIKKKENQFSLKEKDYLKIIQNINNNNNSNNNNNEIPFHVKKLLKKQEIILTKKLHKENYLENLTNHLAKKSNKKVDDLLIKKIDNLRIKNELDDIININSPSPGQLPPYGNWIRNLRSTRNKAFPGTTYLNYGESSFPYYVPVREKIEKNIEIIRDPNSSSTIDSKLLKGNISKEMFDQNFSDNKSYNSSAVNFMKSISNTSSAFDLNSTLKKNSSISCSFKLIKGSENLLVNFFLFYSYFSYLFYFIYINYKGFW